ncbi:MAG: HEAT repeat domain-containing protein [Anaerolineae bacterium]|nr:HEAT repeat domain-containing protein [Anaerolineae bacterium]
MRRAFIVLLVLALMGALALTLLYPGHSITPVVQVVAIGLLLIGVVMWRVSAMRISRRRPPPSQVAEMERLYFRAMREMLNDEPNIPQAINDLQRIMSIDPYYKNARHYMHRALILRDQSGESAEEQQVKSRAEFRRLQERLIDLDPGVRKAVVMELINYGDMAVDPLTALLMDEDADVRVHAATALGWVGGRDAVQPLVVALQDKDSLVRRYAARAMCWVVDSTAVPGLVRALRDEDNYVRSYAARALGWSQDDRAVPPLLELLEDESSDVRSYAKTALEDLGYKHLPGSANGN